MKYAIRDPRVATAIANLDPFETYGSFSALGYSLSSGRLVGEALRTWSRDNTYATVDYCVFSYATPIAWHTKSRGWVVIETKFSSTTGRHQSVTRWGVQQSDDRRVETIGYRIPLTEPQAALLRLVYATGGIFPRGPEKRSAEVLERLGLCSYNFPGQLVLTTLGRTHS